jgi:hypothetical protein
VEALQDGAAMGRSITNEAVSVVINWQEELKPRVTTR